MTRMDSPAASEHNISSTRLDHHGCGGHRLKSAAAAPVQLHPRHFDG